MAVGNALYPLWKQNLLAGTAGYDIDNGDSVNGPYCLLIDIGVYTYNPGHAFFSQLSGIIGAANGMQLTTPTIANGVFDADNLVFTSVPAGPDIDALIIYRHNGGANSTWPLVMYYDTPGGGLPVVPNGGNITVTWNVAGIFVL